MKPAEKARQLEKLLKRLEGKTVLVEGKRDVSALGQLGVGATACNGRTERVVSKLPRGREAVLLFDFDEEGRRKEREYADALGAAGIPVDGHARVFFRSVLGVRTVEETPTAVERIAKENENANAKS